MSFLTKDTYAKYPTWNEFAKGNNEILKLENISYDFSWKKLFKQLFDNNKFNLTAKTLTNELKPKLNMHPAPDLLFNAFILTPFYKTNVVFIGQDPYFDCENHNGTLVHQAMGLSFSVPYGIKIPSSLQNIFNNLLKFKHIKEKPKHGNLEFWAHQGCLMLNTALTVLNGSENKNCHQHIWEWFTDEVIKYISKNRDHVVFVLWGSYAYSKLSLIDETKHEIIISSHPSGLSANNKFKQYPSFNEFDHFGTINKTLKKWNKREILWDP